MGKWSLQQSRLQSELPRLHDLERAVQAELEDVRGCEELFLRSTSELTSLMKKFGRAQGRAYFRYVLRDVFGERSKLYEAREPPSAMQVCAYAKSVIQRLTKAIHFAPLVLRASCHFMLTEFRKAFPDCKHDARIVVGSLLFLRILCPALIKPEMFDFPAHTAQSLPTGVQIAKILQHTLSGTPVGDSDPAFNDSNAFVYVFEPCVANFLVRFSQVHAVFRGEGEQQVPDMPSLASWGCSDVTPTTPTTPTTLKTPTTPTQADDWPPSPDAESWEGHRPTGKMRKLSISSNNVSKNKKKFSLRFWSRGPGDVTQASSP